MPTIATRVPSLLFVIIASQCRVATGCTCPSSNLYCLPNTVQGYSCYTAITGGSRPWTGCGGSTPLSTSCTNHGPGYTAPHCPAHFVPFDNRGECPTSRSCRTVGGCCASCHATGNSGGWLDPGDCMAYTCGNQCSSAPCSSCPAGMGHVPLDETGSRLLTASCPSSQPYMDVNGCCGTCRGENTWCFPTVADTAGQGTARPPPARAS